MCKKTHLAQFWRVIEVGGKAAWLPILIVSSFGLYYNCGNYDIQSRSDRADLKTTYVNLVGGDGDPSNPDFQWRHDYQNAGRQDGTGFKLILGTIDSSTRNPHVLSKPYQAAKIEIGVPQSSLFTFRKNDFSEFFVTCFIYDDYRGHHSEPTFYALQTPQWRSGVRSVTSEEEHALLSGFSCGQMEK
jgi:hypothetical protein